jgi:hypothetical protein
VTAAAQAATSPRAFRGDELIPWSVAARRVGRTSDTLKGWHERYAVPALIDPGGDWLGYQSWVDAVLCSVRPGVKVNIREVTRQWWLARGVELKEVA